MLLECMIRVSKNKFGFVGMKMDRYKLGDICEIVSGSTPKTSVEEYWDGDVKWITPAELDNDSYIITNTVRKITDLAVKKTGLSSFPEGTVILSSRAPIGKVAIAGCEMYCNQGFKNLICSDKINNKYLYWFLKGNTEFLNSLGRGATFKEISKQIVANIEINIPDYNKQIEIAEHLEKINEIIQLRRQELVKLDELIKARFVELFGDPFNNKKWDTQKLRNISVSISDGSNVDKTYYEDKGDVLFLRIQNVWFNEFRLDDSVYISEDVNNEYLDTSLHHGDLLITKIGRYYTKDSSLGRVSVYLGEDDKANYSNNIMRVRLTDEVCSEFVNILMNLDDYNRYIREVSVGGTDKRALSKAIIGDLPIIMPPKELQFEFLEFVRQTDKSKVEVQKALHKAQMLFDSLMQQYFG